MTDSMNFGPDWIRNLSSEGSSAGGAGGGTRYQLADYRYGREDMLALFDRNVKPPASLANFKSLYSDVILPPLALLPTTDEERAGWQGRPLSLGGAPRGRGTSLERGGRASRGRGGYQAYGRPPYEGGGGWGNGEQSDWSPRKEYSTRPSSVDNWRRARHAEEDDGWRMPNMGRGTPDKWGRQSSWRADNEDERSGPPERGGRWTEVSRGPPSRRSWENEEHLPEWANDNPVEGGGSFDDRGAFHGSDDEQPGGRLDYQKKDGIQKSTSQQHISHKSHPPLLTSKSTISLVKDVEQELSEDKTPGDNSNGLGRENKLNEIISKTKEVVNNRVKSEGPAKSNDVQEVPVPKTEHKVEENDFERLQEDFVSKLVVDEDPPKNNSNNQSQPFDLSGLAPPPNLPIVGQDKWFYQDPQGQMQGPFTNMEMSEWFKAGYFGQDLKVRRHCDERFYLLGELIAMCNSNPFQTSVQFPVLKNDISKMPEHDRQFQMLPQIEAYKQAQARVLADPWSAIAVRQHELVSQRLILQQQQVQQDMQYVQPHPPTNPFMHMISQMQQQANKLPPTGLMDNSKQPPNLANPNVDPHLHMMTNFLMQSRLPGNMANPLPAGMPGTLPPDNLSAGLSGLPAATLASLRKNFTGGAGGLPMQAGLTGGLGLSSSVEHNSGPDNDPISKLIKQLHQEKQQQQQQHNLVESFWQQNQFGAPSATTPQQPQWPGQPQPEVPMSMWDFQQSQPLSSPGNQQPLKPTEIPQEPEESQLAAEKEKAKKLEKTKENKQKEESEKELKRKKKAEEEQQKKDAEEKRKQEQRKLEADKKAEAEKRRKEEERIKKELEKAKKEAEDKRLRELEEKRRLKEQRKLEEEAKKRSDEEKRQREEERMQKEREQREREEKRVKEEVRRQEQQSMSKAAPWSQANSTLGMSLAEIQKAEKERKAQEAIIQAQKAQERELQLQQQQLLEKSSGIQLGWAKKAMEPRKVKSFAEIQAEEQERMTKEAAEARLKKEKEARENVSLQTTSTIWSGQSLSWANASSTQSQWSSATNISSGFWDEPVVQKSPHTKPSNVAKSSSMSTMTSSASKQTNQPPKQQQQQQQKSKPKKEETAASRSDKKNHNNNVDDEFTNWCYKALSNIETNVDVPTFVSFLRDIESAFEVREYCKMYLGEGNTTQQFANNFLEKRRSFKPKNAHKDDMCSPAPAITPSMHNNAEFQEVKGKNKKTKKSKMLKVDSRILGFNVTSAQDRINVGDRDYGENP